MSIIGSMGMSALDLFRRKHEEEKGGFLFVVPGVALSCHNVDVDFENGQWVLTYQETQEGGANRYEGRSEDLIGAYLALIANRVGIGQ